MERIDALAAISETDDGLTTRTFGSDAMGRANALVGAWMRAAGLSVRVDGIGNLRGIEPPDGRPLLLLGSHLDTVREAGRFDGPLGVLAAVASVEAARASSGPTGWASSGSATRKACGSATATSAATCSRAMPSTPRGSRSPTPTASRWRRRSATSAATRMRWPQTGSTRRRRAGCSGTSKSISNRGRCSKAPVCRWASSRAIQGQSRFAFRFEGRAGTPGRCRWPCGAMRWRRRRRLCWRWKPAPGDDGLVATVGQLDVRPGAGNVIPGAASGSLDIRSPDDAPACAGLPVPARTGGGDRGGARAAARLATRPGHPGHPCDPTCAPGWRRPSPPPGFPVRELPSGAGHDAVALASAHARGHAFRALQGRPEPSPAGIRRRRRYCRRVKSDGQVPAFARTIRRFLRLPPAFHPLRSPPFHERFRPDHPRRHRGAPRRGQQARHRHQGRHHHRPGQRRVRQHGVRSRRRGFPHLPRRGRSARPLQRTRPHGLGRLRARQPARWPPGA